MKRPKIASRQGTAIVVVQAGELASPGGGRPEDNPCVQYLAELRTPASRRTMLGVLNRCAQIFDAIDQQIRAKESKAQALTYNWSVQGALTGKKVQTTITTIANEGHATMANLARAALRGLARHAYGLGQLDVGERLRIDDVRAAKVHSSTRGRRLSDAEVRRLYAVCARDESPLGRRDAALLAVALGGAMRRFEISGLDVANYTRPSRLGRDPVEIKVKGKGGKLDPIVAAPDVAEAIEAWLELRGRDAGPLFPSSPGRGRGLKPGSRLSAAGVYDVILRRGREAGVAPAIAPHDLRRTAITVFLERTGDLALAKGYARHSSPSTTARYDMRAHDALRRALAGARTGYAAE